MTCNVFGGTLNLALSIYVHWLSFQHRINYKVSLLTFKVYDIAGTHYAQRRKLII